MQLAWTQMVIYKNFYVKRFIKETTFHSQCWMNDFSYHLKSLKVYLNVALNACSHFISQKTPPSNEDRPLGHLLQIRTRRINIKNFNISEKTNPVRKVKILSLTR